MAFDRKDVNTVITNGLFSGNWGAQVVVTNDERLLRILSQGLLDQAPSPSPFVGNSSGGLNDVGTSIRL
jgi:hypothetical protein